MQRMVFVSGPHGAGKTTLIKALLASNPRFMLNDIEVDFSKEIPSIKHMTHYEKTLVRMLYRVVRNHRAREMQEANPGRIILTDRGGICSLAYARVYLRMGWITEIEYSSLQSIAEKLQLAFPTVILNPPIETIMQRLHARTQQQSRIERDKIFHDEDSAEFVRMLWEEFEAYASNPNVLMLRDNSPHEINRLSEWIGALA